MSRVGVIFVGYGTRDLVDQSLAPWLSLRMSPDYDIKICAVSVRFAGFEGEDDGTRERLRWYKEQHEIDHIVDGPDSIPETTARGMALTWLRGQGCDIVIMFDSDEVTDKASIQRALAFIEDTPYICWYRFAYSNLVFDEGTRLAEPFTPPRVFRMRFGDKIAWAFSGDNDIYYDNPRAPDGRALNVTGTYYTFQHELASMTIPESVFKPLHYSWLADTSERAARSKAKEKYQRETRGWQCSFSWDDSKGGLIFNPALPAPRVIRDNT